MSVEETGCCGAYCKTCKVFTEGFCKGCKLGYGEGGRDISRSKCRIKLCCFAERKLGTCADCGDYAHCGILAAFFAHDGHKYAKYRETLEFIRANGYERFVEKADKWKGAYGKLAE